MNFRRGLILAFGLFVSPSYAQDLSVIDVRDTAVISLPSGFGPDGISIARDRTIYVVSIQDGQIVRGNVNDTELTEVLVAGVAKRAGWGMELNPQETILIVAGGFAGTARTYDATTGDLVAEIVLTDTGIVNDVIVTEDAAYFTNSSLPEIYEVPLDQDGNFEDSFRLIPLSGDFGFEPDYFANGNGIVSAGNGALIVNHSFLGKMYAIDIATGIANEIDLNGDRVSSDGIALDGSRLYGVEAPENRVAELVLSSDTGEATVVARYSSEIFDFPTLIALDASYMYVVNGKLSTERGPTVPYEIIRLPRD